ncbi:hypothetical protein [Oligella urethralis]|uniref:DUF2752 domain-containing protein n=1 Tax=Oligella urethralis DNF00040 TaxID=1401065 RepID=A0A096AIC9_9BURK|nr:hypothetical protein [Oligella urethralis]KGF30467.1 hypothetical protein HMPREF2130_06510 [Oligella urethralis DNF00040]
MRTRCPNCGATLSLDALISHDAARDALAAAFKVSGALGKSLVKYLGLFRSDSRDLSMDRVARLLSELQPDIEAQRIQRNRQVYDAPIEAWLWAIEQTVIARDQGRLQLPLKSHGFLYEVITSYKPTTNSIIVEQNKPALPQLNSQSKVLKSIQAMEKFK